MKRFIILFIIIFVTILSCSKQSVEMLPGRWIVDYDRTMKAVMNDKIWKDMSDMERDYFPDILMDTIKGFVMRIDDKALTFSMRGNDLSYPYIIEKEEGNSLILISDTGDEEVRLIFRIIDRNHISFKSSATNDMDFYIWKRSGGDDK